MLRDVFYFGSKPNVHPREIFAENLEDARQKCTTEHFWLINEFCDYRNFDWDFDFEFLPDEDVWAEDHNNVWPSQHQKDSGTWLCPKEHSDLIIYRGDVDPVYRKNEKQSDNWVELDLIDHTKFDFSWHPDPTDPPFIYKWGCKFFPAELKHVLEYRVPGATQEKYMNTIVELLPQEELWVEHHPINKHKFDMSWRPNPLDPPFIYIWGNKFFDGKSSPTLEYHVPGATDKKYMPELVTLSSSTENFEFFENIDNNNFDFTWKPNPTSPPYIYAWGNQWNAPEDKISIQYAVPGATEYRFMDERTIRKPCMDNWVVPDDVDTTGFDFSWEPSPAAPPYIYEFATQWQKTGGPQYVVPGATEKQYVDFQKVKKLPSEEGWTVPSNIDSTGFDFSWHPDATSPPYVYVFATQWAFSGGPVYTVPGATETKYVDDQIAIATQNMTNWVYDEKLVDIDNFDFSWHPNIEDQPYIYEFGTQWQKTGGPKYITPGADSSSPVKYIDTRIIKCNRRPNSSDSNWKIVNDYKIKDFDFSWHPDSTDEPYIYVFGSNLYPAEEMPTVEYHVPGAKQIKFVSEIVATLDQDLTNWDIPDDIDTTGFDFSWKPNPTNPPYIYEFATQHQKTGGPKYKVPGATEKQYLDFQRVTKLPSDKNWKVPENIDPTGFDFSWHPDDTSPPYIYIFATQWAFSGGPVYTVPGATEIKYVDDQIATATICMDNWVYDENEIDLSSFDFSWHPYVEDQPYIYQFGTQWQKTGGPRYITPGADSSSPVKYIDTRILKATRLPNKNNSCWIERYPIKDFDYSWHPDDTEEPYIYVFGNNLYPAEECATVEYCVSGATTIKFVNDVVATLDVDMTNWEVPNNIDTDDFDFSWMPRPIDPPFIYEFGTQWQKTGGPKYTVKGATETKYLDHQRVTILFNLTNWDVPTNVDVDSFDFTWHPDATDPPYIYQFGTQWALTGGPKYVVNGATEVKYMDIQTAVALPNKKNWQFDETLFEVDSFDFSWHPYVEDQPYIYQFGTQWHKTGGPRYITPGSRPNSPIKYVDTRILKATVKPNKKNWVIPKGIDVSDFDFSWVPHPDDPPYIYQFGTQWQKTGGPRYVVNDATEIKYVEFPVAKKLSEQSKFTVLGNHRVSKFDYSWHPDDTDEPYIYVFGNNLYPAEEMPTIQYAVEGAKEIKYVTDVVAKLAINMSNWKVNIPIDDSRWDYTWVPNPNDPPYIYVWGNQWNPAEIEPTIQYVVEGATEHKYMSNTVAFVKPNKSLFKILHNIDEESFDFSWRPNPKDPAYIYVFGNNQYPAEIMPTVEYKVGNATEVKYVQDVKATLAPNKANWKIIEDIVEDSFDFSWVPNPNDPPYIYVFGNTQYPGTIYPTVEYRVRGAKDKKYIDDIVAALKPKPESFDILHPIVKSSFDFSWRPDPTDPPYIYVFGNNQYSAEEMPTVEYKVKGAVEYKYVADIVATLGNDMSNWEVPDNIDSSFDFSWLPHPSAPPYIYEFATVWNNRGGPRYVVPGATEYKYIEDIKARTLPNRKNWEIPEGVDVSKFDFSWVPHPQAPPYIYQFGTLTNTTDGPRYITPGNNGEVVYLERVESDGPIVAEYYIETTLEDLVKEHPDEVFWAKRKNIDYSEFNFSWRPESLKDLDYVQVFGSAESESTQTYFVNAMNFLLGKTDLKFIETVSLNEETLAQIFVKPDVFYVDRGNADAAERFEKLRAIFGNKIQKTRYLNSWVDTVNRCINRSTTELLWVLNSELDYTNFDFDYYPNPWQMKMVHVFGTQWSHWGTTFMVNREAFPEDTKYIKIIEHLSMLNFVKDRRAIATDCVYDIVVIDHGNDETDKVVELLQQKAPTKNVTVVKYNESYLNTIRSLVNRLPEKKEHYLWLCSSVCDYSNFDFSYICDPFARDNLHVFPSGKQKFGDTFLIDINKTKEIIGDLESLEDYQKVNYNGTIKTERLPAPEIVTSSDTLIDTVKKSLTRNFPYAVIMTEDNVDLPETEYEPINLWAPNTKNIIITSTGATRIVAPFEASENIDTEIYDYPYIKRAAKLAKSNPLDIVFVSNKETVADQNYEHLLSVTQGLSNKIHRVDGINGRTEALHAAAESSKTPWFFCVPAKLFVNKKFDWNYQADRLQMPKHYIFNAHNPVNELFYGHQSMVLYNKNLVLGNKGVGLDFTLDSPHMSVELNSGIVVGDTDEHSTWRTAFREAVKLKKYSDNGDETSKERLDIWTTVGKGNYGEWSIKGALDGIEFYNEVEGDLAKLRQSYYWDWLQDRFNSKY